MLWDIGKVRRLLIDVTVATRWPLGTDYDYSALSGINGHPKEAWTAFDEKNQKFDEHT